MPGCRDGRLLSYPQRDNLMMRNEDVILKLWLSRDGLPRTAAEAEKLADQTWEQGPRLAKHQRAHYEHVMAVLRRTFQEDS